MFLNLPTAPLRGGSSTLGLCAVSLSHISSSSTPHEPVKPSAPRGETQKDYKDILQLAEGNKTQEKGCVANTCVWQDRGSLISFSKFSRTKSNQDLFHYSLIHPSPPPRGSNSFEVATGYSYSKNNQKSNSTAGSKATELAAVTHEGRFFYIGAYFYTQNIT